MHTSTNDPILAPSAGPLAALRALALTPSEPLTGMLHNAECQAQLLRHLLPIPANLNPHHLTGLIPSICVTYVDDMPSAGISFWGRQRWNIHVRASDPIDFQTFTVLHELKHIIDHPLRREQPDLFSELEWELLADRFAGEVLADERQPVAVSGKERL